MRSGLLTGGLPRCREVGCPTDYDGYMVWYIVGLFFEEGIAFAIFMVIVFHDYFYDMMIIFILC